MKYELLLDNSDAFLERVSVLTQKAKDYRKNHKMKELYQKFSKNFKQDPFIPQKTAVEGVENIYQMWGLAMKNEDQSASLFLHPLAKEGQSGGAFGKTAICMRFLGVEIPYEEFDSIDADFENMLQIQQDLKKRKITSFKGINDYKLISADMPYIGSKNDEIVLIPTIGQQSEFQWDVARHIFRMMRGVHYKDGDRHRVDVRDSLDYLAQKYLLDDAVFSESEAYSLKNVFYLVRSDIENIHVENIEGLDFLKDIFETNPDFNTSNFWDINKDEKTKRLKRIFMSIKYTPNVYIVRVPEHKKYISEDVYEIVKPLMG